MNKNFSLADDGSDGKDQSRRDQIAVATVIRHTAEVFVDIASQPWIRFRTSIDDSASWPMRHGRVRAEIARLIYEHHNIVLFEQEINRILVVMEGLAWRNHQPNVDLQQALEIEPLFEAVFIFLRQPESGGWFRGTSTLLYAELTKVAKRSGVDQKSKLWPGGPSPLSKRLGELTEIFSAHRITVERGRNPGGTRFVRLERQFDRDDDDETPSQPPSTLLHVDSQGSEICDTCDDATDELFASIEKQPEEN